MRVRLYEVGSTRLGMIFRIDDLPAKLKLDQEGHLQTLPNQEESTCLLEDRGGELFVLAADSAQSVAINETEIEYGPLSPGDQLRLGEHRYVVSYEQTTFEKTCSMKVRVLN